MVDPVTVGLVKLGVYMWKSSTLVDKVNRSTKELMILDTDGDQHITVADIRRALARTKFDSSAASVNMRCMLVFVLGAYERWEKDPDGTNKILKRSKPFLASWDSRPGVKKLEKALCAFFRTGAEEKIRDKIMKAVVEEGKEEIKGRIQEELIGNVIEEILSDMFGQQIAELAISLLF